MLSPEISISFMVTTGVSAVPLSDMDAEITAVCSLLICWIRFQPSMHMN